MLKLLHKLGPNRKAGTAIEYGLIAALIVISMIAALSSLANVTTNMWNDVSTKVSQS